MADQYSNAQGGSTPRHGRHISNLPSFDEEPVASSYDYDAAQLSTRASHGSHMAATPAADSYSYGTIAMENEEVQSVLPEKLRKAGTPKNVLKKILHVFLYILLFCLAIGIGACIGAVYLMDVNPLRLIGLA